MSYPQILQTGITLVIKKHIKKHLIINKKERRYFLALERVQKGEASLTITTQQLGICYRHAQRLLRRFKEQKTKKLTHSERGRPSGNRKPEDFKQSVMAAYEKHYKTKAFGPTLAAENMQKRQNLAVHPETLRLWLIKHNLWQPRASRKSHRSWREPSKKFGKLLQIDGSHHK
jgi:molybdenum-dependent DNA-binding transcriptional regulator ModE